MRLTPAFAVERERVGRAELRREDLCLVDAGQVAVLAQGRGAPRLWGYLLDSALDAFVDGYRRAGEGSQSVSTRLHQGLRMASHYVRTRTEGMLDRRGADIAMIALAFDQSGEQPSVQVLSAGPLHAYLFRGKKLHRLGAHRLGIDDGHGESLLAGSADFCAEQLVPGDLLFAGSRKLCSDPLLRQLGYALDRDRSLSAQAIVDAMSSSASERGLGAACLALRVPTL